MQPEGNSLTNQPLNAILNRQFNYNPVINFPRSRGDSGALNLQSAPAGVIPCLGQNIAELPCVSGVDVWVLRNGNL